jgi:parvulin-like peptidyl-prolyl isomerase
MRPLFVASVLGLSVAGCAQSKSALAPDGTAPKAPVAIKEVPSIYDTINPGVGGPASARTAIKDPSSPQWAGRAQPAGTTIPGQVASASPSAGTAPARPADGILPAPAPLATEMSRTGSPSSGVNQASTASEPAGASSLTGGPVVGGQPAAPPQSGLEFSPSPTTNPATTPLDLAPSTAPKAAAGRAGGIPLDPGPGPDRSQTPPDATAASLSSPAGSQDLPAPAAIPAAAAPKRTRDPLLGPEPDLMPPIPDASELKPPVAVPAAKPAPAASAKPAAGLEAGPVSSATSAKPADGLVDNPPAAATPGKPAAGPAAELMLEQPAKESAAAPTTGPERMPIELAPAPAGAAKPTSEPGAGAAAVPASGATPADLNPSAAVSRSAQADQLAALPPLEPAPLSSSRPVAATARATAPEPAATRHDAQIIRVSALKPANDDPSVLLQDRKVADRKRLSLEPGIPLAKVGDEIITYHDLAMEAKETVKRFPELAEAYRSGEDRAEILRQFNMLRYQTLDNLIDRSIVVQEAKHLIQNSSKDGKMLERIYEDADRVFRESEIEPLLRKENVTEAQLNERFVKQGRSLEARRQAFRQLFLSETFLHDKLKDKIKVELPDLLKYYDDHVKTHEFDRPAQITWRELVVEVAKQPNAEAARKKATGWLERLARGEDFATLAKAESDGPTRSRNQGGLMQTSPGGYAVAQVNAALQTLPIGQISGVIATPESFHVVRVEGRRAAGPASFEEVQDKIRPLLADGKYKAERTAYIAKLRRRTLVTMYNMEKSRKPRSGSLSSN